jgi:titin
MAIVATGAIGSLLLAGPASAAPSTAGPGTMTVTETPTPVVASSTGNTLTFTYTAAAAGVSKGSLQFIVPNDWTLPQKKKATHAGYVHASKGKVVISGSTVSIKRLKVCAGCSITVTYADASAPTTGEISTFATSAAAKGRKVAPLASQPTVTVATLPTAPAITSVTPGDDQLTVQLSASTAFPAITSYTVTCGTQTTTVDSLTVTVTGLTNATQYWCTAYATNPAGNGLISTSASGTPNPQVPGAPIVTSHINGQDSLTVNFTAPQSPETITGYTAVCGTNHTTVNGTTLTATVSGLSPGTPYSCTLFATDADGNGPSAAWYGTPFPGGL